MTTLDQYPALLRMGQFDDLELRRREVRNDNLRLAATIIERIDGGPMRNVGRRRGKRPGGLYCSTKMGRHLGWESKAERDAFFYPEVCPDIVSYREQPHTAVAVINGVKRSYTPDRLDVSADRSFTIVEVKEAFEEEADPDYTLKLEYFAQIYAALGWGFEIVDREMIAGDYCFEALKKVQSHRRVSFDATELRTILHQVQLSETTLGQLQTHLSHPLVGQAKLFAMMVDRRIRIDLRAPLSPDTRIEAATT
jgi:hypothetical protein